MALPHQTVGWMGEHPPNNLVQQADYLFSLQISKFINWISYSVWVHRVRACLVCKQLRWIPCVCLPQPCVGMKQTFVHCVQLFANWM